MESRLTVKGEKTSIVVLGAGPAGLAASVELARAGFAVTLLEKQAAVGGNASSFTINGLRVDYGSHRLHPASDPKVLAWIRKLLGDDLLTRPRHGRIRLMGRWIHFPLRPLDLLIRSNPRFGFGVFIDLVKKTISGGSREASDSDNFASVLDRGLGRTICKEFYFPYSRKIWGVQPEELSASQAYKRVSAGSLGKMLKRLLPTGTGKGGASSKGIFFYPRHGFGQISDSMLAEARSLGVNVLLDASIEELDCQEDRVVLKYTHDGNSTEVSARQVFSTIPLTALARMIKPGLPAAIDESLNKLRFRSMVLLYLELDTDQFTEYDAHYFPEEGILFSRISETKNYTDLTVPEGRTVLCAEIPCFLSDETWQCSDEELAKQVLESLAKAKLDVTVDVLSVSTKRISHAYPLYTSGYESAFDELDTWLSRQDRVLTFGRQGLYAHDNTHHAIFMALEAVASLDSDGTVDRDKWTVSRKLFESHVVED